MYRNISGQIELLIGLVAHWFYEILAEPWLMFDVVVVGASLVSAGIRLLHHLLLLLIHIRPFISSPATFCPSHSLRRHAGHVPTASSSRASIHQAPQEGRLPTNHRAGSIPFTATIIMLGAEKVLKSIDVYKYFPVHNAQLLETLSSAFWDPKLEEMCPGPVNTL